VQTAFVRDLPGSGDAEVVLLREPTEEWFAGVGGRKGGLPPAGRAVLTGVPEARYAAGFSPEGTLVATARGTVIEGWLGITVVGVDPDQRRRGWARRLTLALVCWAVEAGADRAFLQVEETNDAARRLYEGLGFQTAHKYVCRVP
jgi:ribosomal protein S18 acetylase RimI-like enzyme